MKSKLMVVICSLLWLSAFSPVKGQQEQSDLGKNQGRESQADGSIAGKIHDEKSGEDLIGANVSLVGTKLGAATDIEGKYLIKRILPGTYNVRVSFVGYESKTISNVVITAETAAILDVALAEGQGVKQQEVVISADAIKSGDGAILAERRKSASIGDAISSEQMKRTPDATSSDVLKRVVGLTIVDNKFVFIRGASDRYNGTTLNGASLSSTEIGKKSFAFDMIPANLLENTTVLKSATPDLPGDFTGGLVQMNTLDFPESRTWKLAVTTGWNSNTTFKDFQSSQSGSKDWLATDDGKRSLPDVPEDPTDMAKQLPNDWAPRSRTAPVNMSFSLSLGDKFSSSDDDMDNSQFGYVGALSYRNSYQRNSRSINAIEISRSLKGTQENFSALWGAMLNLSYKFSGMHKISLKNNYSQSADDEIRDFAGTDGNNSTENIFLATMWSQRRTYTGIISGEDKFPLLGNLSADWNISVSSSSRQDPDRKDVTYYRGIDDPDTTPYDAAINQRSWSHLNSRTTNYHVDFALPVDFAKIKFGSLYERKTTNYEIRYFSVSLPRYNPALAQLPIDKIYAPENFGQNKFKMDETSKPTDNYRGDQETFASYAMIDVPFNVYGNNFRFTGGARLENSLQSVFVPRTYQPDGPTDDTQLKNIDVLPSANLTYVISDVANLRFAYSHTVNRPEFRELASSGFFDFISYELVGGNPDLKRSYVHNYDVRFEIFPEPGEVVALSYFNKNISNAIEEQLAYSSVRTRSWFNSPHGENRGFELEARKSLRFLGGYLKNFSLSGNYTRIYSEVQFVSLTGNSSNTTTTMDTRPLQGQSPYMVNLSILFTEPTFGTTINVLYNKFGRRLDAVGFLTADIYEQPRDIVDVTLTQPLGSGIESKLTIKNLTNKERVLTQRDREYQRTNSGSVYAVQVSVEL
jgi:hypothetical protein